MAKAEVVKAKEAAESAAAGVEEEVTMARVRAQMAVLRTWALAHEEQRSLPAT